MKSSSVVAAFDFDGTLTHQDILIPFLQFAFGNKKTVFNVLKILPSLVPFTLGNLSRQEVKERFISLFMKDLPINTIEQLGQRFSEGPLKSFIRKEAWNRFQWHKSQGHTCIIVSANLSFLIKPWAQKVEFDHLIASELEITETQRITGKLKGLNCYGGEKVERLTALLGDKEQYVLYAYGDSQGDTELLRFADFPFFKAFS